MDRQGQERKCGMKRGKHTGRGRVLQLSQLGRGPGFGQAAAVRYWKLMAELL